MQRPWGWLTVLRDLESAAPDDAVRIFNPTDPTLGDEPGPWTSGTDVFPSPDGLYGYDAPDGVSFGNTGVRINSLRMVPDESFAANSFFDVFFDITVTDVDGDQFFVDSFFDVFTELSIDGGAGLFDTEIVSMSLSGNLGGQQVEIREDPLRQSTGGHTIEDLGNGEFQVDSFFDVFTELSVDGGASWIPADGPIHMAGSGITDVWAQGEPIFWPTPQESWDMAFLLTTEEVEQELDFGDAPDNAVIVGYPTLLVSNGARHELGGPWLGDASDAPDGEPDGQPDPAALGDDNDGNDDEDGVQIPMLVAGQTDTITFEVNSADGSGGYVDAWIDFNGNGIWEAAERIFGDYRPNGIHTVNVTVPPNAMLGQTFARFRISEDDGVTLPGGRLSPTGPGGPGEVEDHEVFIEPGMLTKWEQWPEHGDDEFYDGWDELSIYGGQQIVADDWVCFTPQPVTDVHWWGSFKGWDLENVPEQDLPRAFHIGIWKDIPANTDEGFSHPGELVWEYISTDYSVTFDGMELDPRDPVARPESAFFFETYLPEANWFLQPGDYGIYWISISAQYDDPAAVQRPWGWLTVLRDPVSAAPDDAVRVFNPTDPTLGDEPGPWASGTDVFPSPDGLYGSADGVSFGNTGVRINSLRMVPDESFAANSFFDVFFDITVTDVDGDQFFVDSFFDVFTELSIDGGAGLFDTEIVSMSLSGNLGGQQVEIREDPLRQSTGGHTIEDLGNGEFQVDSFFDVFTELSVDGGESWTAADGPIHMVGSGITDVWAQGEPIFWPTPQESWDMAFLLTTEEVEVELDFGDAPDFAVAPGYPTLLTNNGARHEIVPGGPWLGDNTDAPDGEADGQPDPNALGDDNDSAFPPANDDEDGVQIPVLTLAQADTITVIVNDGGTGAGGFVEAWMDWDGDLKWDHATEQIFAGWLPDGTHGINVTPPAGSVVGQTFARFRISSQGGLTPEGYAPDGEVEDHEVWIEEAPQADHDFGDAPEDQTNYPTTLGRDGARHRVLQGFLLGELIDAEFDGQPDPAALGDDNDIVFPPPNDDEDGVAFDTAMVPGQQADITVTFATIGPQGYLDAWVDFNGNGDWADAGERIFGGWLLNPGLNPLSFNVPTTAVAGPTFARFRLSTFDTGIPFDGARGPGEVEDYQIDIEESQQPDLDFGDAPEVDDVFMYPTTLANNGARHPITENGPFFGDAAGGPDGEFDGQPNLAASGDDNDISSSPVNDDEEGITFHGPLTPGDPSAKVDIDMTGSPVDGVVNAWVDFDANGQWTEGYDQIITDKLLAAGVVHTLTFPVPATAKPGGTYARFRIANHGGLRPEGLAEDGEVEDHLATIVANVDGEIEYKEPQVTVDYLVEPGTDEFDATARLTLQIGTQSETITLEGPTTVYRGAPAPATGVVQTEIVEMQLIGTSALLGEALGLEDESGNPAPAPILVFDNPDPDAPSLGQIIPLDLIGHGHFPARSFFDVELLIQTPLGIIPGQVRWEADIDHVPALGTDYIGTIDTPIIDPGTGGVIGRFAGRFDYTPIKPAIPVNTHVEFVVRTVVTNAGPYGPADFDLEITAIAPLGTTITPANDVMEILDLAVGEHRTVIERFTIYSSEPSQHHFQIINELVPADEYVLDVDVSNNELSTELRVAVIADADGAILSKKPRLTVTDHLPGAGIDAFDSVTRLTIEVPAGVIGNAEPLSETVNLEGPTTVERSDPDMETHVVETEIVAMQLSGMSDLVGQLIGLPAGEKSPILIFEDPTRPSMGQITPVDPMGDFPADSFFDVSILIQTPLGVVPGQVHLEAVIDQLPALGTSYIGAMNTAIIGPDGTVVARIVGQIDHRPIKPAIPVNTDVDFVVETVVTNAGPFGPADFYLTSTAVAPPGTTITPRGEVMLIEDLAVGEQRTVFEYFTVNGNETSQHHFQITNKITPVDVHVMDTDLSNDLMSTELRVAIVGEADGAIVSKKPRVTMTDHLPDAGSDFFDATARLTLDVPAGVLGNPAALSETVDLEGPTTVQRGDPDPATRVVETEIVAMQLSGMSDLVGRLIGLPAGGKAPILVFEDPTRPSLGQIIPLDPSGYADFPADSFFDVFVLIQTPLGIIPGQVRLEAVIDHIPALNTSYIGEMNAEIIGPDGTVVARIVGQVDYRPIKPAIPVNTDVEFVVETVVTNNGPFGPADFYLTSTAVAPPGTTITPRGERMLVEDLAVGENRTVLEYFTVYGNETSQHHFQITNKITPVDVHVMDLDLSNDLMSTELRVAIVGETDGRIVGFEVVDPPTEVQAGEDVEITLRKVLHNTGPFGPAEYQIVNVAYAPPGATVTPASELFLVALPASETVIVEETFTIQVPGPGEHTFTFVNKIDPLDPHVLDLDLTNNRAVIDLTVNVAEPLDWGDAPDGVAAPGYPTLLPNGARHVIGGPWLGDDNDKPDGEANGQPDPNALGDDNDGNDDEDGAFVSTLTPGQLGSATVHINDGAGGAVGGAWLDAWIDFNGDKVWQAGESIHSGPLPHGMNVLTFPVPKVGTVIGQTFARFRVHSGNNGLLPTGEARDGEVEDHAVEIIELPENTKYVQWPDLTPNGIDIKVDGRDPLHLLADDFECTLTSLLTDVHLWGSWLHDIPGEITNIHLSIHEDDPIGPGGMRDNNEWSMPGPLKWQTDIQDFEISPFFTLPEPYTEWWWDPMAVEGTADPRGDATVWQVDIQIDPDNAFLQEGTPDNPKIYWLDVHVDVATVQPGGPQEQPEFGWKTRQWPEHYMDDAVWLGQGGWQEMHYPVGHPYWDSAQKSVDMAFALTFEEAPGGEITGRKFEDINANGVRDAGDPYLNGWTIELYDDSGNLKGTSVTGDVDLDSSGTIDPETERGWYGFSAVAPGSYTVSEVLPLANWGASTPASQPVVVVSGLSATVDFGNFVYGSIHGFKFEDVDADGIYDPAIDAPLDGVEFVLKDASGGTVGLPATTDANGEFGFTGLVPGLYTVTETVPAGWVATTDTSFTGFIQSREELVAREGMAGLDRSDPQYEIVVGEELMFGNTVRGSIHGFKFEDIDVDGIYDPAIDAPLSGVWFELIGTDGKGNPVGPLGVPSAANGEFGFTDLVPGIYTVTEQVAPGWMATTTTTFTTNLLSRQEYVAWPGQARLPAGDPRVEIVVDELMFGNAGRGSVHGYKFHDINGNGIDDGEPRLKGVEIQLRDLDSLDGYVQTWDAGGGDWQYWIEDLTDIVRGGRNEPVDWSPTGGYGDSGYISTPLEELFVTFDSFWPAYMAPPDPVDSVDLAGKTVRIRVNDSGASSLPEDSLRLFIGEWISETDYVFFAHNTPVTIGNDWNALSSFDVGDDSNWTEIARVGSPKAPSNLYLDPQQWGFTLVGLDGAGPLAGPPSGTLAFDELQIVNEIIAADTTDPDGEYAFVGVEPGRTYAVTETPPAGSVQTTPDPLPIFLEKGFEWVATQEQADELIEQGMDPGKIVIYQDLAFGNAYLGSIHGIKYEDVDRNSMYDPAIDNRWPGVMITLTGDVDGDGTSDTLVAPTDANGEYEFTGLYPGTYTVTETPPPGSAPTTATSVTVTVLSGEEIVALPGLARITDPNDPRHEVSDLEALAREAGPSGSPQYPGAELAHVFQTEILSMDLAGEGAMPLGNGFGEVQSHIEIQESASQVSRGLASAWNLGNGQFHVDSFFDVFFDITVTDVDPGADYMGQPDGASVVLQGVGPAGMLSSYVGAPPPANGQPAPFNFLPPPDDAPYIGGSDIVIPLGDVDRDGDMDYMKFQLITLQVDGEQRTFIQLPGGEVIDSFDVTADITGGITDDITDPPFSIGGLTGPTTARQRIASLAFGNAWKDFDFGDAPQQPGTAGYPTLLPTGARHAIVPNGPWLGDITDRPDAETNGQPHFQALGDDLSGYDDEDGVQIPPLRPDVPTDITVEVSGGGGKVQIWVDSNADMQWDAAEEVFNGFLPNGIHTIPVTIPITVDLVEGYTFARVRISRDGGLPPTGPAPDGEVEDHRVRILRALPDKDFGDAWEPAGYPTTLALDGARHQINTDGPFLGTVFPDAEYDGQISTWAHGDDWYNGDDENGVVYPLVHLGDWTRHLTRGVADNKVQVTVDGTGGIFELWVDWNQNNLWENPAELVFQGPLAPGTHTIDVDIPAGAGLGWTTTRARISTTGTGAPVGWAPDGEVEDQMVRIIDPPPDIKWDQIPGRRTGEYYYGWNEDSIYNMGPIAVDDWYCDNDNAVTGVVWWGSFDGWVETDPTSVLPEYFDLAIWTDTPKADDEPFSHPDEAIWIYRVRSDDSRLNVTFDGWDWHSVDGWETCFRFELDLPAGRWFAQEPGENDVYWLSIAGTYADVEPGPHAFGVKTLRRDTNSLAPDAAVRMTRPTAPVLGSTYSEGQPLYWPILPDREVWENPVAWDLAFEMKTAAKWLQAPDSEFTGLMAYDYLNTSIAPPVPSRVTAADDWKCDGGDVTGFSWWGYFDTDASSGQEHTGAGIDTFHLSIHANEPDSGISYMPYSIPDEPPLWEIDVPLADVTRVPTAMINAAGARIYYYEYVLQDPFPQIEGEIYWLDITAQSNDLSEPAEWFWQESGHDTNWELSPAAYKQDGMPAVPWVTAVWLDQPGVYSDLAFAVHAEEGVKWSQPPHEINTSFFDGWGETSINGWEQIVADDWACDTDNPVTDIHWWGVFEDWSIGALPGDAPEAFQFTIWTDVQPTDPGDPDSFSHPGQAIQVITCREFDVEHVDTIFDPRDPLASPQSVFYFTQDLAEEDWFWQDPGDNLYWISIEAVYDAGGLLGHPFGWLTVPRNPDSAAPDDAVRVFDETAPVPGSLFRDGEPIEWPDGRSWDMAFRLTTKDVEPMDFGDAPQDATGSGYPTLLPNGARHELGGPWLGDDSDAPDGEPNGQPDPNALGDDTFDGNDDEDGVQIPPLSSGRTDAITFEVNSADGSGGYVDAWIDFNGDRTWDASERIFGDYRPNGTYTIDVTPPVGSVSGRTFARFRISEHDGVTLPGGRLSPEGPGGPGEVEDHYVYIDGATVVDRHVFYNNSVWDGNDPAANASDDGAIAPDKTVVRPGGVVSSANSSGYSRGINGIMVDIDNLTGIPAAGDFGIRVNEAASPDTWSAGPAPSVSVRPGDGVGGSARVTLTWPDGAIRNQWVEVTVLSDANGGSLGLASNEVFYFGHSDGDTDGDGDVDGNDYATLMGEFGLRGGIGTLAADLNGNGRVDLSDFATVRRRFGNSVLAPTIPPAAPEIPAAAPAAALQAAGGPIAAAAPVVSVVSQPLDGRDANNPNDDPIATAASVAAVDLLVESPSGYIPGPQPISDGLPATAPYRAATTEYDLRPLGDDPADDGEVDNLLTDILAESAVALPL